MQTTEFGKVYEWTGPTGVKFRDIRQASGAYYHDTTKAKVIDVLEDAIKRGYRIRVFTGDSKTGKSWHDEHDVMGRVSTSMGPHKIPLLIPNRRSYGGPGLLTDCIVRILRKTGKGFHEAYRHPKYKLPKIQVKPASEVLRDHKGVAYSFEAHVDGELHARFYNGASASRWAKFMRGENFGK